MLHVIQINRKRKTLLHFRSFIGNHNFKPLMQPLFYDRIHFYILAIFIHSTEYPISNTYWVLCWDNLYSECVILQILFPYFWKVYTKFHLIVAKITGEGWGTIDWGHRDSVWGQYRTKIGKYIIDECFLLPLFSE